MFYSKNYHFVLVKIGIVECAKTFQWCMQKCENEQWICGFHFCVFLFLQKSNSSRHTHTHFTRTYTSLLCWSQFINAFAALRSECCNFLCHFGFCYRPTREFQWKLYTANCRHQNSANIHWQNHFKTPNTRINFHLKEKKKKPIDLKGEKKKWKFPIYKSTFHLTAWEM